MLAHRPSFGGAVGRGGRVHIRGRDMSCSISGRKTKSGLVAFLLAGVALPWTASAFAQAADSASQDKVETVVVTAEKRSEPLQRVPIAVTGALRAADPERYGWVRSFGFMRAWSPVSHLKTTAPAKTARRSAASRKLAAPLPRSGFTSMKYRSRLSPGEQVNP